jgi:hypothetical protein
MKHVKLFEDFLNENAFSNFSPEEKKAWKKAENKIGDTYFVPSDETEFKRMMQFLGSKNWKFWNTENVPGFSSENINPNKLPAWNSGIGFKLGGTRTGHTYVIPTVMKASTQGAAFDNDEFFKVIESNNISEAKTATPAELKQIEALVGDYKSWKIEYTNDFGVKFVSKKKSELYVYNEGGGWCYELKVKGEVEQEDYDGTDFDEILELAEDCLGSYS